MQHKTTRVQKEIAVVLLMLVAIPAIANEDATGNPDVDRGWLAGIGLGAIQIEFEKGLDGTSAEYALFGGYRFNRYFAAEIAYVDGGEVEQGQVSVKTSSIDVSVLASLPLGKRFLLYGRLGASTWQWEAVGIQREGTDVLYAAGAAINIGRAQLRLEGGAAEWDEELSVTRIALHGVWRF